MEPLHLGLPLHLYTETRNPDGLVARVTYVSDKLVAWADSGKGDAIERQCRLNHERDIEAILAWQEEQFLLLEESWAAVETGWDDHENEAQYEVACDAVRSEARDKCVAARAVMEERRAAIEDLVMNSRRHLAHHRPAHDPGGAGGLLLALAATGVLAYVML